MRPAVIVSWLDDGTKEKAICVPQQKQGVRPCFVRDLA